MQTALYCVKALTCSDGQGAQANACKDAQGCTFPATCTGVAYWLWNWGQIPVAEALNGCNTATCTGSKAAAIQCVVALDMTTAWDSDVEACMTANGCPTIQLH